MVTEKCLTEEDFLLLKQTMLKKAKNYITPLFWQGKDLLLYDINKFIIKSTFSIIDILSIIGVDKIGINASTNCFSDDKRLYIGTLTTNDTLYLTLICEDNGGTDESRVFYVM